MSATAKTAGHTQGFFIAVGCPGCGGELELGEDFWVLRCPYCASLLKVERPGGGARAGTAGAGDGSNDRPAAFVVAGRVQVYEVRFGLDRHLKARGEPLTGGGLRFKKIYYPYWKIDAILLKTRNRVRVVEEVPEDGQPSSYESDRTVRRTEVSLSPYQITFPAGAPIAGVPYSAGLRATYVKGAPFAEEEIQEGYRALPATVSWARARQTALRTVANVGRIETAEFGQNRTEMFRPRGTIVYFPYWIVEETGGAGYRRWIVDGVTGQPAGETAPPLEGAPEAEAVSEAAPLEFGPLVVGMHRCGNCGHGLPEEQSYLYVCRQCGVRTTVEEHPLFSGEVAAADQPAGPEDVLLPFWLVTMTSELAGRLKILAGGMGQSGVLAVPAFRVDNFEAAYRLGRRMTTAAGKFGGRDLGEETERLAPVGVGPAEALVLARAMAARELLGQSSTLALPEAGTGFTGLRLLFVPFHREHYFFIDSITQAVAVEKRLIPVD